MRDTFAIDLLEEGLLNPSQTRRFVSRIRGKDTNRSIVDRWRLRGLQARDGSRVKLPSLRIGGSWVTSQAALGWFFARLDEEPAEVSEQGARPDRARTVGHASAEAILDKMGV